MAEIPETGQATDTSRPRDVSASEWARRLAAKGRCTRCLYDEDTPGIRFDAHGVCSYCHMHDQFDAEYPTGAEGERILRRLADRIRAEGKGKKYDVIVGVSGGCDSSYMIWKAKELGLRPLAAHFDNTWDSTTAVENIQTVLGALDVDLFTNVVDNEEYNDIYRAFLLAGVPDLDAATDIGLATALYLAAERYGVKYMFEGHSFRTEGISPLGWLYMDGKYIESVVKRYGNYPHHRLRSFPNLTLARFLKYMALGVQKIRPLYWMDYQKEEAKAFLSRTFDWKWYGGHHLENRFTAFYHTYFLPTRWGIDGRLLGYSALIRSGQMTREEGLGLIAHPPECDPEIIEVVKKRLGFTDEEFERVMTQEKHTYREFKTYKKTFERLRPLFWLMYRTHRVPKSFYVKYTAKG